MNNQFKVVSFRNRDSFQQNNMLTVACPFCETCPQSGGGKRSKDKKCYGRLFDVSCNNGLALVSYYCKSQRKTMLFRQNGDAIAFMGILKKDPYIPIPPQHPDPAEPPEQIICPNCGKRILDVYTVMGDFHLEIKCKKCDTFVTIDIQHDYPHRPPLIKFLH